MTTGGWREIFRAGDYGDKGNYTQDDLDAIVANFNESDQVPIVVGHPETNSPAWGWITGLRRIGDILQAREGSVHPAFAKARDQRLFKNRSVRICRTKNGPKLLHLGWLGAALPEVEGLSNAVFCRGASRCVHETDETEINFALAHRGPDAETINQEEGGKPMADEEKEKKQESMEQEDRLAALEARIRELEAALAAEKAARAEEQKAREAEDARREEAEFSAFVDEALVGVGRLPQAGRAAAVDFLKGLAERDKAAGVDFSREKGDKSAVRWFMDFARSLPAAACLAELPAEGHTDEGPLSTRQPDLTHKV